MTPALDPSRTITGVGSMDTYGYANISQKVIAFLTSAQPFQEWPDCRQVLLNMIAVDESWIHALPVLGCLVVGGKAEDAIPLAAAWTSLRHAANLMDDVQDGDLHRYANPTSPVIATSYALAFIFAAFQILDEDAPSPEKAQQVIGIFARAGLDSSRGQHLDLTMQNDEIQPRDQLESYWMSVIQKSGSIYYAGLAGAAAAGTDADDVIEALGQFGIALGVIRQVIDDCRDILMDAKDVRKAALPVLLKTRLTGEVRQNDPRIVQMITDILMEWKRRALASLEIIFPSPFRQELVNILEHVLQPSQTHNTL